jgi:hypothetical protein
MKSEPYRSCDFPDAPALNTAALGAKLSAHECFQWTLQILTITRSYMWLKQYNASQQWQPLVQAPVPPKNKVAIAIDHTWLEDSWGTTACLIWINQIQESDRSKRCSLVNNQEILINSFYVLDMCTCRNKHFCPQGTHCLSGDIARPIKDQISMTGVLYQSFVHKGSGAHKR